MCACHLLNTIGKRATLLYSSSQLDLETKNCCKEVHSALVELQRFVTKLRSITVLRQTLGTALHIPVATRWLSWLSMLESFMLNADRIKQVVEEQRAEFLDLFKQIYEEKLPILNAFSQILGHLKMRVTKLEVKIIHFFNLFF